MTVSVALCTYNGAAYLGEQLASLAGQTRPPDEVVVFDDRSADDSVGLVERFAAAARFPVRVEVNEINLGAAGNFARAVAACRGDLIALCDQDDVWRPDKLTVLERVLAGRPAAGLAFSDADAVDAAGRPLGYRLWDGLGFRPADRRRFAAGDAFGPLLRRNWVTGATAAFRSAYRDLILPIPDGWMHDAWIALMIAAVADCVPVAEPLIRYRQHPAQQIGGEKLTLLAQWRLAQKMNAGTFRQIARNFAAAYDRLAGRPDVPVGRVKRLADKVRHAEARAGMRECGRWRLPGVLRELAAGNYGRYSRGWKAAAQDLFLA